MIKENKQEETRRLERKRAEKLVESREKAVKKSTDWITKAMFLIPAWYLRNCRTPFGKARMTAFFKGCQEIYDDIEAGRLSVADIDKQLEEELNLRVMTDQEREFFR